MIPIFRDRPVSPEEIQALVRAAPEFSEAFMALYRAYTLQEEQRQELLNRAAHDSAATMSSRFPYDEVRDWVQAQHNHFEALDRAAERLFEDRQFGSATLRDDLIKYMASTPEQVTYLNMARTVGRSGGSYLARRRSVTVVLGCEVRFTAQTIYAEGLDLSNPNAAEPIGPGCRACERTSYRHRSLPPTGRALDVGTAERGVVPYRVPLDVKLLSN